METKQEQAWAAVINEMTRRKDSGGRGEVTRIAELLEVTRGTVSRWMSGSLQGKRVSYDKTLQIMKRLGLDPAPYFGGEDLRSVEIARLEKWLLDKDKIIESHEKEIALLKRDLEAEKANADLFARVVKVWEWVGRPLPTGRTLADEIGVDKKVLADCLSQKNKEALWPLLGRILAKYPQISRIWLYSGLGWMLLADNPGNESAHDRLEVIGRARQAVLDNESGEEPDDTPNSPQGSTAA